MRQTLAGVSEVSIEPPEPAGRVAAPQGFLALYRGGDPPLEVAIVGSQGSESMQEFKERAMGQLNAAGLGPRVDAQKLDDQLYGDRVFELYSVQSPRQLGGSEVLYYWYIYFTEAAPHQVMVAFLFPHDRYETYGTAMVSSLETLRIGEAGGAR